jgi:hypothetical protein
VPDERSAAFWEAAGRHVLTLARCSVCGTFSHPPDLACDHCGIIAETGLPKIAFHDLRRTAATLLKDLGVPARDAQVILGHSHISVTLGIYSEVFDDQISTALDRMDGALSGRQPGNAPHHHPSQPTPPHLAGP